MGRMASTEPQCLYKGALYLTLRRTVNFCEGQRNMKVATAVYGMVLTVPIGP